MMKKSCLVLLGTMGLSVLAVSAQRDIDPRSREEKAIADRQAQSVFRLVDPLGKKAGESTVVIYHGRQRVCYGIVVGEERVIAKWSDLFELPEFFVLSKDGQALAVEPQGIYSDQDLVLLKVPGLVAPAMTWGNGQDLTEGTLMVAVDAEGHGSAMGVVSVANRSQRNREEGFLGIEMDGLWKGEGIRVRGVTPGGAAAAAGIQPNDVLLQVGGEVVNGLLELQTRIRRLKAGDQVSLHLRRGEEVLVLQPTLQGFEMQLPESPRLSRMDRMTTELSLVRDNFPNVIQSDIGLAPRDSGSPIVNLDGEVVGMVIARADRVSTLILPAEEVLRVLATDPQAMPEPSPRRAQRRENPQFDPRPNMDRMQNDLDSLRKMLEQHLDELQLQP